MEDGEIIFLLFKIDVQIRNLKRTSQKGKK